jgi:hypothetical protein
VGAGCVLTSPETLHAASVDVSIAYQVVGAGSLNLVDAHPPKKRR